MMKTDMERSMMDQQNRIQMLAHNISQRSNGLAAFDVPVNEVEDGDAPRGEGSSFAKEVEAPSESIANSSASTSRFDAIAKLKRAASQREMRDRGPEAGLGRAHLQPREDVTDTAANAQAHLGGASLHSVDIANRIEAASPFLALPLSRDNSKSVSPTPLVATGSVSPSPQLSLRDYAGTPEPGSLLNRSRSQRGDARSPLPSLEQLRARILQERATAGLARSASTSAASAAARAYALEKLLGESPREGAVSPVSDTAEDQEEDVKEELISSGPSVASTNSRLLLRRSRTIGGLSAAADAQRKAAFVQALDEGVPEDVKSTRRSSRRFAKAPPGGRMSKPSDPPVFEETSEGPLMGATDRSEGLQVPAEKAGANLDRSQSQRQIARTEMMRKLSGRGRVGQRSPLPGPAAEERAEHLEAASSDISSSSPLPPATPPATLSLALPSVSPSSNLLTVPGAGYNAHSPSSRPSTGMTSLHESDRNRASEMARLMGEEAFEYERLLEMGYTTDDAYERVASARSGSYIDMSANASPRSIQGEFFPSDMEQQHSPLRNHTHRSRQIAADTSPGMEESVNQSVLKTSQSTQGEWPIASATFASIPLGLDSGIRSSANGLQPVQNEQLEVLENDDIHVPSNRRAAWPESVTSAATFGTMSSPKHSSGSTARDSEGSRSASKHRPANLDLPHTHSVERIEEVLSPGFLHEIGNPLDYFVAPEPPTAQQDSRANNEMSEDSEFQSYDGSSGSRQSGGAEDDDYLQEVDQMTKRLERFARRNNNSTTRSDRDAAVQQSSAAQAIAAASQDAQRSETPAMIMVTPLTNDQQQIAAAKAEAEADTSVRSLASTPRSSPPTSFRPLPNSQTHSAGESSESFQHYSNGKLSPFPGLLNLPNTSAKTSTTSLNRKPSPLPFVPNPSMGKAVNFAEGKVVEAEESKAETAPPKSPGFFTTLRRKASNAASRAQDNKGATGTVSTSPTSRKFGSLLRRKPSEVKQAESKKETESPTTSLASLTSTSTLKLVPSTEQGTSTSQAAQSTEASIPARSESLSKGAEQQTSRAAPRDEPPPIVTDAAALHRYSRMLTSPKDSSGAVGILGLTRQDIEHPPRSFLFATPVLQVMTTSTVKDRYLFVFSDLLVLAKPIARPDDTDATSSSLPTLEWTFSVKDIVDIGHIKQLTAPTDERRRPARNVAVMEEFVQQFQWKPLQAIDALIDQSGLAKTPATIAQLLHQTPELDRQQLTKYLFSDTSRWDVTKSFIELEKLSGVSIESALRSLLLEIRFPDRRESFEGLLIIFAKHWTKSNKSMIKETFSEQIAIDLVFAIMALNDALHGATHSTPALFGGPNPGLSKDEFLQSFRPKDKDLVLSDRTLSRIYISISQEAIQQASLDSGGGPRSVARILSPGIPTRLVYGVMSGPIQVSIPHCDPDFTIRLYGEDLAFQPQVLSFGAKSTQEFKVMSKSLGPKSIVFIKAGRNARYYQTSAKMDLGNDSALPRSASLVVERAFKQHCFTIGLPAGKRYTLSVEGETKKTRCVDTIKAGMAQLANDPSRKRTAHSLALHVLKEALMDVDEAPSLQRSASAAVPTLSSRIEMGALNRAPSDSRALGGISRPQISPVNRKESVSKHYYQSQGKRERGLAPSMEEDEENIIQAQASESSVVPLRGEELITTVKQNSLLSVIVTRLRQDRR